eukprot:PITA_24011
MREIFRPDGMPKVIISDMDVKFTSSFWKALFTGLGTQIHFRTVYHPQTDGQTERVNQVVKDMLCNYVMHQPGKWEEYLHLVEFAYNNGYHESLKISPFEVLYGRKCTIPANWNSPEDKLILGSDMLEEMDKIVKRVRQNLKVAQDRQKMYANKKRTYREFQVGDLRVEPKGEFLVEPLHILDQREVTLRKQAIIQVKVQWKHFSPEEATWEDKGFM